jgi:cyanophycinase-like exopeptidase
VLVGGGTLDETADIARAAIEAMSDESPAVFVPTASATPEAGRDEGARVVAQIEEMGGPAGYVAPIFTRTDATDPKNTRRLMNAGLVYLGDGLAQRLVEMLADTPAFDALAAAYRAGAVIVAAGQAASALGVWCMGVRDAALLRGWGWLPDAIICPSFGDVAAPALRAVIKAQPECLGLGIPRGVALALGPENQVRTLSAGGAQVTVVLGPRLRQGS